MSDSYPYYLANKPATAGREAVVADKHTGAKIGSVRLADRTVIDAAIAAAAAAAPAMRKCPAYRRQSVLQRMAQGLQQRHEEFAQALCAEVGKPIRDARGEVTRAIDTFRIAAEEAVRITGEFLPLDISPRAEGYEGVTKYMPIGPCSFITPFNFPLNLAAHKIAPAIAVGCPFVLKPAPQTPITSLMLAEMLADAELPPGAFSVLPCDVDDAAPLIEDDRIKLLSFTGSASVGWMLKARAGKKKVVLELGGNAACIVDRDADVDAAVERIVFGAFYQSGQSCISVQRLLVHAHIYEKVKAALIQAASQLKVGDPRDESTFLGPLISERDAIRVEQWIAEAVDKGAKALCGNRRNGAYLDATILEHVPADAKLSCEEAFGPVLIIEPFDRFDEVCRAVNASRYGLQAGVFTRNLNHAFFAFNELEVGGVIINDVPSMRVDSMPYGGVKDSGLGREGVRYAMQEMSELRLMVLKNAGSAVS